MRTCPNCGKVYSNDLFYCLDDGTRLRDGSDSADPAAPTEVAYDVNPSLPTEVLPSIKPTPVTHPDSRPPIVTPVMGGRHSILPYTAIGLLVVTCLGLAGTLIVLNLDRILPSNKNAANSSLQLANMVTLASPTPATPTPATTAASSPAPTTSSDRSSVPLDPSGRWAGSWSTASGTLFDLVLTLSRDGNSLNGSIRWTMRRTARPDKSDKVGHSATEFVRGTYDPETGAMGLTGYSKDDPDDVLVMIDVYKLRTSSDGRKLTGAARNGGKWNGNVDLAR